MNDFSKLVFYEVAPFLIGLFVLSLVGVVIGIIYNGMKNKSTPFPYACGVMAFICVIAGLTISAITLIIEAFV